nr:hypothetical protein HmN_000986800 [Hymenolepis microstoma]
MNGGVRLDAPPHENRVVQRVVKRLEVLCGPADHRAPEQVPEQLTVRSARKKKRVDSAAENLVLRQVAEAARMLGRQ